MSEVGTRSIDAMIVGAQKAGTTSLARYLAQHPDICSHERLELSYFVDEHDFRLGYPANFERYFGGCGATPLLLAKSVTVMTEQRLVRRLQDHNPAMRLIAVLRDPVDRAYSAYWWARSVGYESIETFEEALAADPARHRNDPAKLRNTSYVAFGEYAGQIEALVQAFGWRQVRVYLYDDLAASPEDVVKDTLRFLEIDPAFVPRVNDLENTAAVPRSVVLARMLSAGHPLKRAIRTALPHGMAEHWKRRVTRWNRVPFTPPPMDPRTRDRLAAHFAPHNRRLAELLNRDLSSWTNPASVERSVRQVAVNRPE